MNIRQKFKIFDKKFERFEKSERNVRKLISYDSTKFSETLRDSQEIVQMFLESPEILGGLATVWN